MSKIQVVPRVQALIYSGRENTRAYKDGIRFCAHDDCPGLGGECEYDFNHPGECSVGEEKE